MKTVTQRPKLSFLSKNQFIPHSCQTFLERDTKALPFPGLELLSGPLLTSSRLLVPPVHPPRQAPVTQLSFLHFSFNFIASEDITSVFPNIYVVISATVHRRRTASVVSGSAPKQHLIYIQLTKHL